MLLYYRNKCWNTDVIPSGLSSIPQGVLATSRSQLQYVPFSFYHKEWCAKHQSMPFNMALLFYKRPHGHQSNILSLKHTAAISAALHWPCCRKWLLKHWASWVACTSWETALYKQAGQLLFQRWCLPHQTHGAEYRSAVAEHAKQLSGGDTRKIERPRCGDAHIKRESLKRRCREYLHAIDGAQAALQRNVCKNTYFQLTEMHYWWILCCLCGEQHIFFRNNSRTKKNAFHLILNTVMEVSHKIWQN